MPDHDTRSEEARADDWARMIEYAKVSPEILAVWTTALKAAQHHGADWTAATKAAEYAVRAVCSMTPDHFAPLTPEQYALAVDHTGTELADYAPPAGSEADTINKEEARDAS